MAETVTKQQFRQRLEQERLKLIEEIKALSDQRNDGIDSTTDYEHYSNHEADVATETYEAERNLALEENLRQQLAMTDAAIARFEEGTYGVCTNCGRSIDPERLEALPHADLCIDCKRQQEAQR